MSDHVELDKTKDAALEAHEHREPSVPNERRRDFFKLVGLGGAAAAGLGGALYSTSAMADGSPTDSSPTGGSPTGGSPTGGSPTDGPPTDDSTLMRPPEFDSIASRPTWELPDQARVAVMVVVNVEHFIFGKLGTAIQPHLTSSPEIANYGWRDYGNRVGIWRLFDMFDELEIPVTAAVNGDIGTYYPEIVAGMQQRQWEFMAHGINNSTGHSGMAVEQERELIQKTLDALTQATGKKPKGWLTPGFSITDSTIDLLHDAGIVYTTDWVNDDQPYWYPAGADKSAGEEILAIPYTLEANDITLCLTAGLTGPEFSQAIMDQFDQLWLEGETQPRVMAIGLHPFIVGQPLRLKYLKQCLSHIKDRSDTWLTTGSEIYDWVVANK